MATKRITTYKIHRFCDWCGNDITNYVTENTSCSICEKDMCRECINMYREYTGNVATFRDVFICPVCLETGSEYMKSIAQLEQTIKMVIETWQDKAMR